MGSCLCQVSTCSRWQDIVQQSSGAKYTWNRYINNSCVCVCAKSAVWHLNSYLIIPLKFCKQYRIWPKTVLSHFFVLFRTLMYFNNTIWNVWKYSCFARTGIPVNMDSFKCFLYVTSCKRVTWAHVLLKCIKLWNRLENNARDQFWTICSTQLYVLSTNVETFICWD